MTRGGKRVGAGRPDGTKKETNRQMVSLRLSQDAISVLEKMSTRTGRSKTSLIEKGIWMLESE